MAYGQALHWVSRVALDPQARGVRLCVVEKLCLSNGWHVYRVQLPEGAYTGDEFMELVQWLERRIRPARPRAWIESPWPRSTTESGFAVYDAADGELAIRTDRSVDIRVADARTGVNVLERLSRQNVSVQDLQEGVYDLIINDLPHETFIIEAGSCRSPPAVLIQLADQQPIALAYAQSALDALVASGTRSVPLQLTWAHPAVGSAVHLDGRALGQDGALGAEILMSPGMRLDAASLGACAAEQNPHRQRMKVVRWTVHWRRCHCKGCCHSEATELSAPDLFRLSAHAQAAIRRRFIARHTSLHSARTF